MAVSLRNLVVWGGLWAAQNLTLVDLDEAQQIAERGSPAAAPGGQPPPTNVECRMWNPKEELKRARAHIEHRGYSRRKQEVEEAEKAAKS